MLRKTPAIFEMKKLQALKLKFYCYVLHHFKFLKTLSDISFPGSSNQPNNIDLIAYLAQFPDNLILAKSKHSTNLKHLQTVIKLYRKLHYIIFLRDQYEPLMRKNEVHTTYHVDDYEPIIIKKGEMRASAFVFDKEKLTTEIREDKKPDKPDKLALFNNYLLNEVRELEELITQLHMPDAYKKSYEMTAQSYHETETVDGVSLNFAQDFIDALRSGQYIKFLNFGNYIHFKYAKKLLSDSSDDESKVTYLDSEALGLLSAHELSKTDINEEDFKKINQLDDLLRSLRGSHGRSAPDTKTISDLNGLMQIIPAVIALKNLHANGYSKNFSVHNMKSYKRFEESISKLDPILKHESFTKEVDAISLRGEKSDDDTTPFKQQDKLELLTIFHKRGSPKFFEYLFENYPPNQIHPAIDTLSADKDERRELKNLACNYLLKNMKKYIEKTDWHVSFFGGKKIKIGDKVRKVPTHVAKMYEQVLAGAATPEDAAQLHQTMIDLSKKAQSSISFFRKPETKAFYQFVAGASLLKPK